MACKLQNQRRKPLDCSRPAHGALLLTHIPLGEQTYRGHCIPPPPGVPPLPQFWPPKGIPLNIFPNPKPGPLAMTPHPGAFQVKEKAWWG